MLKIKTTLPRNCSLGKVVLFAVNTSNDVLYACSSYSHLVNANRIILIIPSPNPISYLTLMKK